MPYIQFVSLRPELCLQLPSDSSSPRTPLLLANGWHYQPPYRTFTDEKAPLLGAQLINLPDIKTGRFIYFLFNFSTMKITFIYLFIFIVDFFIPVEPFNITIYRALICQIVLCIYFRPSEWLINRYYS